MMTMMTMMTMMMMMMMMMMVVVVVVVVVVVMVVVMCVCVFVYMYACMYVCVCTHALCVFACVCARAIVSATHTSPRLCTSSFSLQNTACLGTLLCYFNLYLVPSACSYIVHSVHSLWCIYLLNGIMAVILEDEMSASMQVESLTGCCVLCRQAVIY
jgi:hypothetical protein